MKTVEDVNAMTLSAFLEVYGDIAEHSPWVALEAASHRPFASREAMIASFEQAVKLADREAQLALICAHPDLATRAKLTQDSSKEQAGAGFDTLTAEEFARFTELNSTYKQCFGFPFIFAVKGASKYMILDSFTQRVGNDVEAEFIMAIAQVCRIFRFRIEDRVLP